MGFSGSLPYPGGRGSGARGWGIGGQKKDSAKEQLGCGIELDPTGVAMEAARRIEQAVDESLEAGVRTPDAAGSATTSEVGRWIAARVAAG